jgi:hypothetical protein
MKKVLSIILAALMLLAMVPAVYAATPTISTTLNKSSVKAGDIVTLTAKVSANSNLCSLEYEIYYDTSAFQVVANSGSCKDVFEEESHNPTSGKIKYIGASANGISGSSKTFFTIQFKALKSNGTISVAVTEAYTANGTSETNVTSAVNSASAKTFTFAGGYLSMRAPSKTTIRYKDGIVLHADTLKTLPSGSKIKWTASNGNFKTTVSTDGKSLTIVSDSKGDTVFTATLYNSSNVEIDSVSVEMTSKAGFFDKIGGFFRGLFGMTKIYAE